MDRRFNNRFDVHENEGEGNNFPYVRQSPLLRCTSLPEVTQFPTILPASRVALLADESNLYHSAKAVGTTFSYENLIEKLIDSQLVKAIVFRVEPDYLPKNNGSITRLSSLGYQVVTKTLQISANGKKKGDIDVDLACHAFHLISKVDVIFLASGDSDFVPLATLLQNHCITVHVLGFQHSTSNLLINTADSFIPVGQDLLNGGNGSGQ